MISRSIKGMERIIALTAAFLSHGVVCSQSISSNGRMRYHWRRDFVSFLPPSQQLHHFQAPFKSSTRPKLVPNAISLPSGGNCTSFNDDPFLTVVVILELVLNAWVTCNLALWYKSGCFDCETACTYCPDILILLLKFLQERLNRPRFREG